MKQKEIKTILRIFMGLMFLFSGGSKLFPIEAFEAVTVQQGVLTWDLVPYLSRTLIGFELLLGILFLMNIKLRRFTIPGSLVILSAFTIYLIYLELTGAGGENCGCFGEILPMSGVASIIKNLVFIGITAYLLYSTGPEARYTYAHIGAGFVVVMLLLLFAVPVKHYEEVKIPKNLIPSANTGTVGEQVVKVKTDSTFAVKVSEKPKTDTVKKEPGKPSLNEKFPPVVSVYSSLVPGSDSGIKLIAFLSLDCDHCLAVATELNANNSSLNMVPRYYLFLGSEDQVEPFFSKSGGSVNYSILTPQKFYPHLSSAPPKVVLLVNGNPVSVMEGESVSVKQLTGLIKELNSTYSKK